MSGCIRVHFLIGNKWEWPNSGVGQKSVQNRKLISSWTFEQNFRNDPTWICLVSFLVPNPIYEPKWAYCQFFLWFIANRINQSVPIKSNHRKPHYVWKVKQIKPINSFIWFSFCPLFFFFVFSPSLLFCPPLVEFNFSLEKGVKNYSKMVSSNNRGRFNKIIRS